MLASIIALVTEAEGPYKSYIMLGVIFLLAAFFTRFVFKTLKWVLAATIIVVVIILAIQYVTK